MIGPSVRRNARVLRSIATIKDWISCCSPAGCPSGRVLLGLFVLGLTTVDPVLAAPPGGEQSTSPGSALRILFFFIIVPSAVFAGAIGLVASGLSRVNGKLAHLRSRGGPALAILGVVAMANPLYADFLPVLSGATPPLFGFGVGLLVFGLVLSIASIRARLTYWPLIASAVLATAVAAGAAVVEAMTLNVLTTWVIGQLPYGFPLFALIPAGYALGQGDLRRSIITATTGFAAAMTLLAFTSGSSARGLGLLLTISAVMYAVAIAVLGSPVLAVGAALSTGARENIDRSATSAD